jgi:ATP-dependent Zn protease
MRPRAVAGADVGAARERRRQTRLLRLSVVFGLIGAYLWYWLLSDDPVTPHLPDIDPMYVMVGLFFFVMLGVLVATTFVSGRSPHITYRPEQIDVRISDVKGLPAVTEEVQRTIDLFLAGRTFRSEMGGTPRRGVLFEGPPGTGKTLMAKAMAAEVGVPFLFVSATAFQSMYYGATARRIRSYFTALRKAAASEGGAIGFIEEIDAIAGARGGLSSATARAVTAGADPAGALRSACGGLVGLPTFAGDGTATAVASGVQVDHAVVNEGVGGVVNELLVQMQSFDAPTGWQRARGRVIDWLNLLLPAHRQVARPRPKPVEVLLIAATNRADGLDPALLRPGRFDRRLSFDLPDKASRREIIDHFLGRKAHEEELAGDDRRDALAGVTQGYSPVMIEHLLDEALINAVRRNAPAMSWPDVEHARLVTEVGLGQPVGYTEHEKRLIATHEAGHAVTAWLVAPHRRLEVLTIIRRAGSLGLLAHGDAEDVYTRSRRELEGLLKIAFGGMVAEELFLGDTSTGVAGDLAHATNLAAQMVGHAGMAGTLISFSALQGPALTSGNLVSAVLGDREGRRMVEDLLQARREDVRRLLGPRRHLVAALRDALLERHELIGREIVDVLREAEEQHRPPVGGPVEAPESVIDVRDGARPDPSTHHA